jgi:hypothetical protein
MKRLEEIRSLAFSGAYGSNHIICHTCADVADKLKELKEDIKKMEV